MDRPGLQCGRLRIEDSELEEHFIHGSGPGGQNVNKVASTVQLRFDVRRSPSLPEDVRQRLMVLCGRRLSNDGIVVLVAGRHRTQERNRADARERLAALVEAAAEPVIRRRATRPTLGSKKRRLAGKSLRAGVKRDRSRPVED